MELSWMEPKAEPRACALPRWSFLPVDLIHFQHQQNQSRRRVFLSSPLYVISLNIAAFVVYLPRINLHANIHFSRPHKQNAPLLVLVPVWKAVDFSVCSVIVTQHTRCRRPSAGFQPNASCCEHGVASVACCALG